MRNAANGEHETRGALRLNATSLAFTLGALVAAILALAGVVVLPVALSLLGLGGSVEAVLQIVRWPALIVLILAGLAILYRFGPGRPLPYKLFSPGSMLATARWIAGSAALSFYLSSFANYDATYGSLGAAIGLMMWMWISSIIILLGAEVNSVIYGAGLERTPFDRRSA